MSHEREKENEDNQNIQSAEENQYVQVKMKEKQRELGTESRLNASIESGYKREITIYSILLATAVTSLEIYNSFHPTIYSLTEILSSICKKSWKFVGSAETFQK